MALTATTLAAAFGANEDTFKVTSATGATVPGFVRIDDEYMLTKKIDGVYITVKRRGDHATKAEAHNVLAPVVFGLSTDLPSNYGKRELVQSPQNFDLKQIGANGVIPVPDRDTVFVINKGSALGTSTFADPSKAQSGLRVTFVSGTDFAHVVTTTTANDGTTGAHTTLTSAAFIGSSVTLMAWQGRWLVISNNLFVIT